MEAQDEFIMRKSDDADVGLREDYEEVLADVDCNCNTDLYVVNQGREREREREYRLAS